MDITNIFCPFNGLAGQYSTKKTLQYNLYKFYNENKKQCFKVKIIEILFFFEYKCYC